MKPRSIAHPDVRAIMAAIDRAIASPLDKDSGLSPCVASDLLTLGSCGDEFEYPGAKMWPSESLRAIVLAYATTAPVDFVKAMVDRARRNVAWVEWWELPGGGHDQAETSGDPKSLPNYKKQPR
jgi:hypothetical protein